MLTAHQALQRLREGNARFVNNQVSLATLASRAHREELASGQEPFAIILGCSDSRVPAEMVFDQGLGDLFVIRVAGNIVAPSQVGSVEFAASRFGTRLVVVLGHSRCGAILVTLEELEQPTGNPSRNMRSIVDRVRPSVEELLGGGPVRDRDALVERAARGEEIIIMKRGTPYARLCPIGAPEPRRPGLLAGRVDDAVGVLEPRDRGQSGEREEREGHVGPVADTRLERANGMAKGRLRHAEPGCGFREAALPPYGDERAKIVQGAALHLCILLIGLCRL